MARVQWCIGNTTLREAARLKGGKGANTISTQAVTVGWFQPASLFSAKPLYTYLFLKRNYLDLCFGAMYNVS